MRANYAGRVLPVRREPPLPPPNSLALQQRGSELGLQGSLIVQLRAQASGHRLEAAHGGAAEARGQRGGGQGSGGAGRWRQPGPQRKPPGGHCPTEAFSWPLHFQERNLSTPASGEGLQEKLPLCLLLAAWPGTEPARAPALATPVPTSLPGSGSRIPWFQPVRVAGPFRSGKDPAHSPDWKQSGGQNAPGRL